MTAQREPNGEFPAIHEHGGQEGGRGWGKRAEIEIDLAIRGIAEPVELIQPPLDHHLGRRHPVFLERRYDFIDAEVPALVGVYGVEGRS